MGGGTAMRLSVVICTHNREADLAAALRSLEGQRGLDDSVEIIVVDNRSTDGTPEVVARAADRGLPVRRIADPVLGASHARNTGWRVAAGRCVAFLDDDVELDPGWIGAALGAIPERAETIGAVGGRVKPLWRGRRPAWAHPDHELTLSYIDYGPDRLELPEGKSPIGANIIYPRAVLDRFGGFREELGRKGGSLLGCEETYLERQIRAAGLKVVYEPGLIVGHHIHAERLTRRWRYRRAYWQGASLAMCDLLTEPMRGDERRRRGMRRAVALLIPPVRTILLGMIGRRSIAEWFYGYSVRAGYAAGLLGMHQFQIQARDGAEHEADEAGK